MPCNCGHISCICGIPCLCDDSKCRCKDCAAAIGRVCNMCNKSFYYEYLTIKETSEEEVCNCFMVQSQIRGSNSTAKTMFYAIPKTQQENIHVQSSGNQIIQHSSHYHAPFIPESFNEQWNDPSFTDSLGSPVLTQLEQVIKFAPESLNVMDLSDFIYITLENAKQNELLHALKTFYIANNAPASTEHSENTIPVQSEQVHISYYPRTINMHTNNCSNLGAPEQLQNLSEENCQTTVSCERREQMITENNFIEQDEESLYTMPRNEHPTELHVGSIDSSTLDSDNLLPEWKGLTLKLLETLSKMKIRNDPNISLVTKRTE